MSEEIKTSGRLSTSLADLPGLEVGTAFLLGGNNFDPRLSFADVKWVEFDAADPQLSETAIVGKTLRGELADGQFVVLEIGMGVVRDKSRARFGVKKATLYQYRPIAHGRPVWLFVLLNFRLG